MSIIALSISFFVFSAPEMRYIFNIVEIVSLQLDTQTCANLAQYNGISPENVFLFLLSFKIEKSGLIRFLFSNVHFKFSEYALFSYIAGHLKYYIEGTE